MDKLADEVQNDVQLRYKPPTLFLRLIVKRNEYFAMLAMCLCENVVVFNSFMRSSHGQSSAIFEITSKLDSGEASAKLMQTISIAGSTFLQSSLPVVG